ncbi:thioredoxin family redox-active protein [Cystoisospora suis]|uniref:Thioredoxin family redox-active protein n=1 Tax=Cystoisospora suis TaxID=483139 RepID=A0A2C6LFA0_9APIC|nr:thioredoxin family redox-active protein [Cystoisospora suis]
MGVLLFDRLSLSSQRSPPSSCSSFSRSTSHSSSSEEKPSVFTPYTSATHVPADSDLLVVSSSSSFASSSSSSSSFTPSPDFDSEEDILPASSTSPSSQKKSLYLTSSATSLEGKYVGLFFGAAWCPYCKTFMTSLLNFYNLLHPTNMFEVVYVPLDRNMREYKSFVNTMPW